VTEDKAAYKFALANIRFRWKTYFVYSIASILSIPIRYTTATFTWRDIYISLIAGLVMTTISAPILWLGFKGINRIRLQRRHIIFLTYLLIVFFGAFRGTLIHFMLPIFGLQDNFSIFQSVISSSIFTFVFFTLASLLIELITIPIEVFQKEFSKATFERLKLDPSNQHKVSEIEYLESLEIMKVAVEKHLPSDKNVVPNQKEIFSAAREIQIQIQEVLRPLSHRLWIGTFGEIKSIKISQLCADAIRAPKFSVLALLGYQFFFGFYGISLVSNYSKAAIASLVGTGTSAIIILLFISLKKGRERIPFSAGLGLLIIMASVPIAIGSISENGLISLSKLIGGVLIAPTLPIFIFISSLYNLILNDKEFAIFAAKSVRMQQMSLLKNQQELIKIHNLAGYVHNSLQPELLRISKHLEMTSASAANVDLEGQLDALSIALSRSLEDVSALRETGLDRLQKVIEAWAGIAEISLEIPKFLELDPDRSILLVDLIEEMITNSIRLGKASEIKISILLIGESTKVELAHNGSKIDLGGTGLGSQWIAQYSSEKPYLDNHQNRMTYTLSI